MSYRVTPENDDIVIRIPRDEADERTLNEVLGYLELEQLARKGRLSEPDAVQLSKEVKQGAWGRVKYLFT